VSPRSSRDGPRARWRSKPPKGHRFPRNIPTRRRISAACPRSRGFSFGIWYRVENEIKPQRAASQGRTRAIARLQPPKPSDRAPPPPFPRARTSPSETHRAAHGGFPPRDGSRRGGRLHRPPRRRLQHLRQVRRARERRGRGKETRCPPTPPTLATGPDPLFPSAFPLRSRAFPPLRRPPAATSAARRRAIA
jgi:hypothetical protein